MAPLLKQKRVVQVVSETVKGTEVTTGFSDLLAFNPEMKFGGQFQKRNGTGKYTGNTTPGIVTGRKGEMTFEAELRANASHGMDDALAVLFPCCKFPLDTGAYKISSSLAAHKTCTIRMNEDGKLKILYGASGTWEMNAESGGIVTIKFTMTGLYKAHTDAALPTYAPGTKAPMLFSGATFTVGGAARKVSKFSITAGIAVSEHKNPAVAGGVDYFLCSNEDVEVGFDPEEDLVAADDHFSRLLAGTSAAVVIVVNDGTDKATITLPAVQMKEAPDGERDGQSTYEVKGQCNHSSGDDAISIAVATI
jgi:hypothetical protein